MARRAEEQIRNIPVRRPPPTVEGEGDGVVVDDVDVTGSPSTWYRTTAELIMQMSKLWGRGNDRRSADPRHFVGVVTLASDLLDAFMTVNEHEMERHRRILLRRTTGRGSAGEEGGGKLETMPCPTENCWQIRCTNLKQ